MSTYAVNFALFKQRLSHAISRRGLDTDARGEGLPEYDLGFFTTVRPDLEITRATAVHRAHLPPFKSSLSLFHTVISIS